MTDTYAAAAPKLKRALRAFRSAELPADVWRRWVPHAAHTALLLWDFDSWQALAEQQVQTARADGTLITLPISLSARIAVHVFAGELTAATALLEEVETGRRGDRTPGSGLWRRLGRCLAGHRKRGRTFDRHGGRRVGPRRGPGSDDRAMGRRRSVQRPRPSRASAVVSRAGQRGAAAPPPGGPGHFELGVDRTGGSGGTKR